MTFSAAYYTHQLEGGYMSHDMKFESPCLLGFKIEHVNELSLVLWSAQAISD